MEDLLKLVCGLSPHFCQASDDASEKSGDIADEFNSYGSQI